MHLVSNNPSGQGLELVPSSYRVPRLLERCSFHFLGKTLSDRRLAILDASDETAKKCEETNRKRYHDSQSQSMSLAVSFPVFTLWLGNFWN